LPETTSLGGSRGTSTRRSRTSWRTPWTR
jgi:hypothetical protein